MLLAKDYFLPEDEEYIINIRREIHMYPEIGFDLPRTIAVVKRELDAMGIPYTEEYGRSSVVATINGDYQGRTIGFRADMDALPMEEHTDVPFKSKNPGAMHSCGHDAHTAMLLGAARAMKRAEKDLKCRVKLLFQPSEEGEESGAACMVEDGVMDDIDVIFGQHGAFNLPTGQIGIAVGEAMAACHPYTIEFFGKSVHATMPQYGKDALAMAVKAYQDIYLMKCREIEPFDHHILSISSLEAGSSHNTIADYAKMRISFRFYSMETHDKVDSRIKEICQNAASELGGSVKFTDRISAYPVCNDHELAEQARIAARKIVGEENVVGFPPRMSSEDFSHYLRKKPGMFIRLGMRNDALGCVNAPHTSLYKLDEGMLFIGSCLFTQIALDQQNE